MVRFDNLSYSYTDKQIRGLKDINLTVNRGNFVFICAPTAEYKTTFLKLVYGEFLPTSGRIEIFDYELPKDRKYVSKIRKKIGYAMHPFNFFDDLTVRENLMIPLLIRGSKKSTKEINKTIDEELQKITDLNPLDFVRNLSSGEKQVLNILRALIVEPLLILLDDPFKYLQKEEVDRWMKIFFDKSRAGITIIATTSNVEIPQRYQIKSYFLKNGRLLEQDDK